MTPLMMRECSVTNSVVIAGCSRPKDGVVSLAYDPAIHLLAKQMDPRVEPAGDDWVQGEFKP